MDADDVLLLQRNKYKTGRSGFAESSKMGSYGNPGHQRASVSSAVRLR